MLGMLGAIAGYKGYGSKYETVKKSKILSEDYPEFYEKLKQIKIAVVPKNENGYIQKKFIHLIIPWVMQIKMAILL